MLLIHSINRNANRTRSGSAVAAGFVFHGAWFWRAAFWSCWLFVAATPLAAQTALPAAGDLDRLLQLMGHRGAIHNEMLYARADPAWREQVQKLGTSAVPEVRETVRRMQPIYDLLDQVSEGEKKAAAELREKNKDTTRINVMEGVELLHGPDEFQLDEMVRRGMISRDQADEQLRRRGELKSRLIQGFGESLFNTYVSNLALLAKTHRLRNRAEVLKSDLVREVLLPAVRARSGPASMSPPVDVSMSVFPNFEVQPPCSDVHVILASRSPKELTQVTLMFEIKSTEGSRFAMVYIPKLPPFAGGRLQPIALSATFLNSPPAGDLPLGPQVERVRYALWCDQCRSEAQEPIVLSKEEMVDRTRLLALRPGLVYVSQGGTKPNMTSSEIVQKRRDEPGWRMPSEAGRRYEITFKTLRPKGKSYEIELEMIDHQTSGSTKQRPTLYRGELTLPPVKLSESGRNTVREPVVLKVRSGAEELELTLSDFDGKTEWRGFRRFVSQFDIPAEDTPTGLANQRLQAAMQLGRDGKFEEARAAYQAIIADYPGSTWETAAKMAAAALDRTKEGRAKADALLKARDEFRRKNGLPTGGRNAEANNEALEAYRKKTGLQIGKSRQPPDSEKPLTPQERKDKELQQAELERRAQDALDLAKTAIEAKQPVLARTYLQQVIGMAPTSKAAASAKTLLKNLGK